jgi:hypothetical protein
VLPAALSISRHIKQDARAILKVESMPDFWKAVAGAIGSVVGACIAFVGVWLTQRSTAEREERKSDQEKEAALRAQALQFITDVVSAARAMSALTYYASALPKGAPDSRHESRNMRRRLPCSW